MRTTVLVVSPDPTTRRRVTAALREHGVHCVAAPDVAAARATCTSHAPGVAVLDRRLPGNPTAALGRVLRHVPIVVLSPVPDELAEVAAFAAGADDFVVWPSPSRARAARLTSLARRARFAWGAAGPGVGRAGSDAIPVESELRQVSSAARPSAPASSVLSAGEVSIDVDTRRAFVAKQEVHLTRTEFELLRLLLSARDRVLPRAEIVRAIWGDWPGDDHLIEVHVSRLRRKIVTAGGPSIVEAVRGVGYRLRPVAEPAPRPLLKAASS